MEHIVNEVLEYCQNDMEYLQEIIDNLQDIVNNNEEETERRCSVCNKIMKSGYCIGDGQEYYCSDDCLHKRYSQEVYNEMYESNCAYYTEWE